MNGPLARSGSAAWWSGPGRDALARAFIAPAPAALLAFWGLLVHVFGTQPIRPYTDGAWAPGDLVILVVLGAVIGLFCRTLSAVVGILLGVSAAVALQLFVLAGQAHYQPVVVAAITPPAWTLATAGALGQSIGALVLGVLATRALVGIGRLASDRSRPATRSRPVRPDRASIARFVVSGLAVLAMVGLMAGYSLITTARSAYLRDAAEPIVKVVLQGDRTLTVSPGLAPAGRTTIVASGTGRLDSLALYGPLSPEDEAMLADGRVNSRGKSVYWVDILRRAELAQPGRYAFVALDATWEYPSDEAAWMAWDGSMPVTAMGMLQATAADPHAGPTTEAGGDGGAHLTPPAAAALATAGWAAAGALFLTIRRWRRPTTAHVWVAVTCGLTSAAFVWMLASIAISQAHSPF